MFEYNDLDYYFDHATTINMTKCPKCKSILTDEPRYQNVIKERFADIQKVKVILLQRQGNPTYLVENAKMIQQLLENIKRGRLRDIRYIYPQLSVGLPTTIKLCRSFDEKALESTFISTYKLLNLLDYFAAIEYYYNSKIKFVTEPTPIQEAFIENYKIVEGYFVKFNNFTEDFFNCLKLKIVNMFIYVKLTI